MLERRIINRKIKPIVVQKNRWRIDFHGSHFLQRKEKKSPIVFEKSKYINGKNSLRRNHFNVNMYPKLSNYNANTKKILYKQHPNHTQSKKSMPKHALDNPHMRKESNNNYHFLLFFLYNEL